MIDAAITAVVLGIGWYTVNMARNAWSDGNKRGAAAVMLLALTAVAMPLALLFGIGR